MISFKATNEVHYNPPPSIYYCGKTSDSSVRELKAEACAGGGSTLVGNLSIALQALPSPVQLQIDTVGHPSLEAVQERGSVSHLKA